MGRNRADWVGVQRIGSQWPDWIGMNRSAVDGKAKPGIESSGSDGMEVDGQKRSPVDRTDSDRLETNRKKRSDKDGNGNRRGLIIRPRFRYRFWNSAKCP